MTFTTDPPDYVTIGFGVAAPDAEYTARVIHWRLPGGFWPEQTADAEPVTDSARVAGKLWSIWGDPLPLWPAPTD